MLHHFAKGKTAVFIDASNIYFSQKTLGWKIDLKKLLEYFKKSTYLFRITFYGSANPDDERQKEFHDFLEIIGYVVKTKKIKCIKDAHDPEHGGHHKANLDVDLAIDAVHFQDQFETFVLLSGDGDFESLLTYLKARGKRCIVISTKKHVSIELVRQAKFIDFKKLRTEFELK